MGLGALPPELQLHIFGYLVNDYTSLRALVHVSRQTYDCAREVLQECRTLDLWAGSTDNIEEVLMQLYTLANDSTATVPHTTFSSSGSFFGDNLIRHASRYNKLSLCFDGRDGFASKLPLTNETMSKLEAMWAAVAGNRGYDIGTWRYRMSRRLADTSIRLILRTMLHITTLQLGGCTNVLPWSMQGILPFLHTLQISDITNKQLSQVCCRIASLPHLVDLQFSHMSISGSFFTHFKDNLSITHLRFMKCWVTPAAMQRALGACRNLELFEYLLSTEHRPANSRHHHLYSLITDLGAHANTLKLLKILVPDVTVPASQCNHVTSLAQFSALRRLVISYKLLAPHTHPCRVEPSDMWQVDKAMTPWTILSRLPPTMEELHLHRGDKMPIIRTLSEMVDSVGPAVLPKLRFLEVTLPWRPGSKSFRVPGLKEAAVRRELGNRGVNVVVTRPRFD